MEKRYLQVAKIVSTFGLNGEFKVFTTSSFAEKRYKKNSELLVKFEGELIPFHIEKYRIKDAKFDIIKFKEISDINDATKYVNCEIFVEKDDKILNKNEFFFEDLKGLEVYDQFDTLKGKVENVEEFPAQYTLKVKKADGNFAYVPFVDVFIKKIDLENKIIYINNIEGLL